MLELILLALLLATFCQADLEVDCSTLRIGQYICNEPDIHPDTQQPRSCTKENVAKINCTPAEGMTCKDRSDNGTFEKEIPCKYTNGYSFETALLLSIFLGMFGIDRFYLGYPAIGLLKLSTLGFMFLGQLVDIILIAAQIVTPADGSNYIINYFGPSLSILTINNETYRDPYRIWSSVN